MPYGDEQPERDIDQEIRINELRERARELAGGEMTEFAEKDLPPDLEEAFWRQVVEYEQAPSGSDFELLQDDGVDLPAPDDLSDEQLTAKLWEVIHALARRRTYVTSTDHLSDRELYTELWQDVLHEENRIPPGDEEFLRGCNCHIDLVSSGSEEDIELYLRYYADEETRQTWVKDFPEEQIPPHEDPPYDRDSKLPKPDYGVAENEGDDQDRS